MGELEIDRSLVDHLYDQSGAAVFLVDGASDVVEGVRALERATRRVNEEVRHPEEPTDPFASFWSRVAQLPETEQLVMWGDFKDADAYRDERIFERAVEIIADELRSSDVGGRLTTGDLAALGAFDASYQEFVPPRSRPEPSPSSEELFAALPGPNELGPWWRRTVRLASGAHTFCANDSLIRRGPNERPQSVSGLNVVLVGPGVGPWVTCKVTVFSSEQEATDEFAWSPYDLQTCASFDSAAVSVGANDFAGAGSWSIIDAPTFGADEVFAAQGRLRLFTTGQGIAARLVLTRIARLVLSVNGHAVEPMEPPDIDGLISLVVPRLRKTLS